MRALTTFSKQVRGFLESMIAEGDIRCIWHLGHQFVPLEDIAPYAVIDLDEEEATDLVLSSDADAAPLLDALNLQSQTDQVLQAIRDKLKAIADRDLGAAAPHGFAQISWLAFWSNVAAVAVNFASENEAQKISAAMRMLEDSAANGTIGIVGLPNFHKVLLSLAAPELGKRFDEIWSAGYGLLEIKDMDRQPMVLAVLRRLTKTFTGYRGEPEGSETPSRVMNQYLDLVSLRPAS